MLALGLTVMLVPIITCISSRPRRDLLTRTQAGGLLLAILNVMGYYTRFAAGECDDGGVS